MASTPPFTLRQLSYLVAVADHGSIAAGARDCHVSPSALADGLDELERILDDTLLVRRRAHGVSLTTSGTTVVARARRLLAEAEELGSSLSSAPESLSGPISVACYPTLAPAIFPRLLGEFAPAHPGIEVRIEEATHDRLQGRIESGGVDVAFVYDLLIPGEPRCHTLYTQRATAVFAAEDPMATRDTVTLEELAERDLILLDAPPSRQHTMSLFRKRGLVPRIAHTTSSYEVVRTLVGRGLGYGILVQREDNPASYEGRDLVRVEIAPEVEPVGVDMIWSAATDPPARVRALLDFCLDLEWTGAPAT